MKNQLCGALLVAAFLAQGACATNPTPKAQITSCAAAHFPVELAMAGSLQGFAGQYSNGVRSVTLRQDGYSVLVAYGSAGERELRKIGEWRFQDGCGVTYQLSLPLNGTGALLEVISPKGQSTRLPRVRRG
jgi:hypothetical protein